MVRQSRELMAEFECKKVVCRKKLQGKPEDYRLGKPFLGVLGWC